MTHFISHFPALKRRMTNVTQQIIFIFYHIHVQEVKLDCVHGLSAFIPTLKYLKWKKVLHGLCNTLEGT